MIISSSLPLSFVRFISSLPSTHRTAFLSLWVCEIVAGHNVEYGGGVGGFALIFYRVCWHS
jgi:NADH:ubiquinone oxidoreductase subunit H